MRKLVAATTVLLCLCLAPAAAAAAPPEFYGVVSGKFDPTEAEFDRMGAGRVGTMRISLAWASVQPAPGAFDWSRYDALVGQSAAHGIHILANVYGTPAWAASRPHHPPTKQHYGDFEAFLRAAVERYGPNGTFWADNPQIPKLPITDWQLLNEVNSPTFWTSKPNPKVYKQLLVVANRAINGVDPGARIILAGLFMTPRIKHALTLEQYLTALYRRKSKPLFDAVAVHPYSPTPGGVLTAVEEVRALMDGFKDKRTPIWLTEVGWASAGQKTPLTVSRSKQARYLRQTFKATAARRGRLGIEAVLWYALKDVPGSNLWIYHAGLLSAAGTPKPSWASFVNLTGGTP